MDKPEPLKLNSRRYYCVDGHLHNERILDYEETVERVKSAVEWLKNYIRNSKTTGDKGLLNADYVLERIDEAFPDLNTKKQSKPKKKQGKCTSAKAAA